MADVSGFVYATLPKTMLLSDLAEKEQPKSIFDPIVDELLVKLVESGRWWGHLSQRDTFSSLSAAQRREASLLELATQVAGRKPNGVEIHHRQIDTAPDGTYNSDGTSNGVHRPRFSMELYWPRWLKDARTVIHGSTDKKPMTQIEALEATIAYQKEKIAKAKFEKLSTDEQLLIEREAELSAEIKQQQGEDDRAATRKTERYTNRRDALELLDVSIRFNARLPDYMIKAVEFARDYLYQLDFDRVDKIITGLRGEIESNIAERYTRLSTTYIAGHEQNEAMKAILSDSDPSQF